MRLRLTHVLLILVILAAAPTAFAAERPAERDESLFSGLLILLLCWDPKVPKRRLLRGGA